MAALLRNLLATLIGPLIITAGIPALIIAAGAASIPAAWSIPQIIGALVTASGLVVACWCMWAFIFVGRGMPTSVDPPKRLVTTGLYRYVRNPMYGGVLLILLGEAIFCVSAALALDTALSWLALHLFVTRYEEPAMRRRFGDSYDAYCRVTPRWAPARHRVRPSG